MSIELALTLRKAVLTGEAEQVRELTERLLGAAVPPEALLDEGLIPAMSEAGELFEKHTFFLPDLLLAARAMKESLALLRPLLAQRDVEPRGRAIIGTVAGDLHDIGKNIVAAMLEGGGFEVIDLGYDVAPSTFVDAVREMNPEIVALSALLTTSVPVMKTIILELERAGLRGDVKVLVGGAPLTAANAAEMGADAYAPTAPGAVQAALRLLAGEKDSPATTPRKEAVLNPRRRPR